MGFSFIVAHFTCSLNLQVGVHTQISQIIVFTVCVYIYVNTVMLPKTSVTENPLHANVPNMVYISLGREEVVRRREGRNGEKKSTSE